MTLVMAEKDQPIFRDFLGIGYRDDIKQVTAVPSEVLGATHANAAYDDHAEAHLKPCLPHRQALTFSPPGNVAGAVAGAGSPLGIAMPSSSDPGSDRDRWSRGPKSGTLNHGMASAFYRLEPDTRTAEKRDLGSTRESLQERLQMSVEALEAGRPPKQSRIGDKDFTPSSDDLRLSMQPPRQSAKAGPSWLQNSVPKPDTSPARSSKRAGSERVKSFTNGLTVPRLSQPGAPDRASRELHNTATPVLARPAADEGSRTGLQGPGIGPLINGTVGAPPTGPSCAADGQTRRPKVTRSTGSDSLPPSSRVVAAPASRQLTIFYGGQAHVFDDVPPDKAEDVMTLAGSYGRSWSTTYSPRPSNSMQTSASDGSLSALGRDREKETSLRGQSVSSAGIVGHNPEVQTLLQGLAQSGIGGGRPGALPVLPVPIYPPFNNADSRGGPDWVANGSKQANGRSVPLPTPCNTDPGHDGLKGQKWM